MDQSEKEELFIPVYFIQGVRYLNTGKKVTKRFEAYEKKTKFMQNVLTVVFEVSKGRTSTLREALSASELQPLAGSSPTSPSFS